ncbi:MAG: M20/M25/M40 family metallo-hydrolase [Bacilli bacterium]|nr:M20/M25/M40 family metallo-hydrolase [Bacilli bacterium]
MENKLDEILNTLEKLINCPGVSKDNKLTNQLLDGIQEDMPKDLFFKKYDFDGFGSLVISNTEDTNFDIVFCTHIDVVPCEEYKYTEDDTNVYGRGSFDMKGQLAVLLTLFKELRTDKKVALFITSDEEIAGNCAKQLVDIYPNIKLAIIPDGGKDFWLIEEEKGQLQIKLSVKTKTSHASQPYNGVNAIEVLYKCYLKLLEKYPIPLNSDDYKTSVTLTKMVGGDALNQVPGYAEMYLDIRHVASDKKEDILHLIKEINPNIEIDITAAGSAFTTDVNNPNIKMYLEMCKEVLGYEPKIVKTEATSDAIYFSDKNIPTALMNPIGDYPHCPNEFVNKKSLLDLYKIYEKILKEGMIKW